MLNADNIQAGGATTGVPATVSVAAPNLAGINAASSDGGAMNNAANQVASQGNQQGQTDDDAPSIITVEVLGYGGG